MIGDRIKTARLNRGMTLEDVAHAAGITRQTVQKYEAGIITNVPSDKIEAIAKALRVAPAYLMGWEEAPGGKLQQNMLMESITDDVVSLPVFGEIAAGFDSRGEQEWDGDLIDIPRSYLKGHPIEDYFLLRVKGDSMYPLYMAGDVVLVLRQSTLNRSGDIGVILIDDELTLKKVEFVYGEDWMKLIPINPVYAPRMVVNEDLEKCRVQGIPRMVIREIND